MTHLSDEQLEDVLAGSIEEPVHLAECAECRARLGQQREVQAAVRRSFGGLRADGALADRVRASLSERPARVIRLRRIIPLAIAAVLTIAAGVTIWALRSDPLRAGLVDIHSEHLSEGHEFHTDADPEKLAAYMTERLGFTPSMPKLGEGMALRGCCFAHFRDRPVGSYVVDTPKGAISVIVVTETPETIGIKDTLEVGGRSYGVGSFARCRMATVRLGDYTYCAVGEVPAEMLADLLGRLTP